MRTPCGNCNRLIGELETKHTHGQHTVCEACSELLKPKESRATERLAGGVEKYIGTPRQLWWLFWVLVLGGVVILAAGYFFYRAR